MVQPLVQSHPEGEADEAARLCKLMNDVLHCLNACACNKAMYTWNVLLVLHGGGGKQFAGEGKKRACTRPL